MVAPARWMTTASIFAAFMLAVSTTLPSSAEELSPAADAELSTDDECRAEGADPGCAVNQLQSHKQKVHAKDLKKEALKTGAARASHTHLTNVSRVKKGPNDCHMDTQGSCVLFGCSESRGGAVKCERGRCLCEIGYCASKGACIKRGSCPVVTSGTCNLFGCAESRGEVECRGHKCICKAGHCAGPDGKCIKEYDNDDDGDEDEDEDEE